MKFREKVRSIITKKLLDIDELEKLSIPQKAWLLRLDTEFWKEYYRIYGKEKVEFTHQKTIF